MCSTAQRQQQGEKNLIQGLSRRRVSPAPKGHDAVVERVGGGNQKRGRTWASVTVTHVV